MFKKTPQGYYVLEKLASQKGIVHAFSTRKFGDCNPLRSPEKTWPNVEGFLKVLNLKKQNLMVMEQVHGDRIKKVNQVEKGNVVFGVDGLITQKKGIVLGVHMADCLPLLFYDPVVKIVGVTHAGWRGVFKEIPQKTVQLMIRLGSFPENILVGVGPSARGCCYEVGQDLEKKFTQKFGKVKGMLEARKGETFLNLEALALIQLVHSGVLKKNVEFSEACTVCQNQEFFSKRKDKQKTYGGMLGIITLVN